MQAAKQRHAETLLEREHLAADRRLRQGDLGAGAGEAEMARRALEGDQELERRQLESARFHPFSHASQRMQSIPNERLRMRLCVGAHCCHEAAANDTFHRPRCMHARHATGVDQMNQDLINGSRSLDKGRIRHVHAEKGRRVECLRRLALDHPGRRSARHRPRRRAKRSTSTAAATPCSAPSPTHATCCSTPARRSVTGPGP